MATHPLPDDPSLEQLRKQARELQRGVRTGEDWAIDLAAEHAIGGVPDERSTWKLSAAQLTLARIHEYPSWPALVRYLKVVERYRRAPDEVGECADPAEEFLRLACLTYGGDDPARALAAARLLADHPGLGRDHIGVAAARCDVPVMRRLLTDDPGAAARETGPHRWAPLAYLCYARHDPALTQPAVVQSARLLLEHGADPDTGYLWHGLPSPFTALTGVFGHGEHGPIAQPAHPQWRALARVLLEAGADANDAQTLYNRMFSPDTEHLVLLFAHGLGQGDGGGWKRLLGHEALLPEDMLLGQLAWAVIHGYDDRVRLLAEHGVDLDAKLEDFGGKGHAAYETALRAGRTATAKLLLTLGASPVDLPPAPRLVAAVLAADRAAVEEILAADPDAIRRAREQRKGLVAWAATQRSVAAVRLAVELGWDLDRLARTDVPSDQGWETALHAAAGAGDDEMVRALLDLGADPTLEDRRFHATPLGWAEHFERASTADLLRADPGHM